jgi:hypothetical protein
MQFSAGVDLEQPAEADKWRMVAARRCTGHTPETDVLLFFT